jgi:hypothetical protein
MIANFTPGPWRAVHNGTCWQIDAETDAVATTQFCYAPEVVANARLIAAAPDLFEALAGLIPPDFDDHPLDFSSDWQKARVALAHAGGRMK